MAMNIKVLKTEEDYQNFSNNPHNDFSLWQVAWHNNEVAAFVLSKIRNGIAEITEVSTIEKFRRQGLAQTLLTNNLKVLKDRGIKIVRLHTNSENVSGARSLYEKIGFKHLKNYIRYRKPIAS